MSRSVNRVILVGNAGSDPDVGETPSGSTVAHLSLATNMYVEGRIEYGSYDRDGVAVPTTDVIVQEFVFLDQRANGDSLAAEIELEESTLLD